MSQFNFHVMDSAPHGRRQEVKQDQGYHGHGWYAPGGYPNLSEDPRIVLARKAREKTPPSSYICPIAELVERGTPIFRRMGRLRGKRRP